MRPHLRRPAALQAPVIPPWRRRSGQPSTSDAMHNAKVMRWDAVAMGVVNAASTYLPVLVARLGGSAFNIGLLTAIPAVAGFALAIPIGQYLQRNARVITWYSVTRMLANLSYGVIALAVLLAPPEMIVPVIIAIWAIAAIPSTMGTVLFPVVMDGAAGPRGRLELMSRRWSIVGLTMAITVAIIGQFLDRIPSPVNYAIAFMTFTLAGLVSYYFSRQFRIPRVEPPPVSEHRGSLAERIRGGLALVRSQPAFLDYSIRHLVYLAGTRLVLPLVPLYYVTVVEAPDAWIGIIATGQSLALIAGYQFWRRQSRLRGTRILLLVALTVSSLFPAALSLTDQLIVVAALAAVAAFFTAGVDLILFDELMRTVPRQYGVTFVSIDTTLANLATIVAPLLGAALVGLASIEFALQFGAFISLCGVVMFVRAARRTGSAVEAADVAQAQGTGLPDQRPKP